MKFSLSSPFFFLFISLPILVFSQDAPKWGNISEEEKSITETELDSEADAIVLTDYGEFYFNRGSVELVKHTRIKILNKNGISEADIAIPFYAYNDRERIIRVKAHTLNLDDNGKIVKSELEASDFYMVDLSEKVKELRFAFPNVKPGSIIEYRYVKWSKDMVSEEWRFQNKLPTLKSYFSATISAGLDYSLVYNGERLVSQYKSGESRNNWELENIPPLKDESYCMNPDDYVESIKFQLAGYSIFKRGNKEYIEMMTSWKQLSKEILDTDGYKGILKSKKSASKILKKFISKEDNETEKIKKIYTYVQTVLEWDEKYRLVPSQTYDEVFDTKIANSAEINLCLVKLLQVAGFDASPVIISTKDNGLVTKVYPLYTQFNHVIAQVALNGKDVLMDAVSKVRPYNLLGIMDLNPSGYLLDPFAPRWVEIPLPKRNKSLMVNEIKFKENEMKHKISFSFYKHEAAGYRGALKEVETQSEFVTNYLIQNVDENDLELDSFKIMNENDLDKPLIIACYFSREIYEDKGADIIYINPFLNKHYEKNPFTNPVRYLPVDFIVPSVEKLVTNIHLPKGYVLEERPTSRKVITPEEKVTYSILCQEPFTGMVQISSEFVVKEPLIKPEEYESLRDLFNKMIGFQDISLVLRKK